MDFGMAFGIDFGIILWSLIIVLFLYLKGYYEGEYKYYSICYIVLFLSIIGFMTLLRFIMAMIFYICCGLWFLLF